ncbi:MAG TPA: DUF4332 domain-containing protein [Candidatus Dormibacteraeota bacterium]|nr:DUF4332 domain-containing protein [Candidatus Dormibacteraeota bacterium]
MYRTLEYLRGIAPDECRRLRGLGVQHSNQLLHFLTLDIDRRKVSRKTGIPAPRLLQLARQCALLEISGIDRHLDVVHRLGIDGLKALKAEDAGALHDRLRSALGPVAAPQLTTVEYWISQARSIDILEEDVPAASEDSPSLVR